MSTQSYVALSRKPWWFSHLSGSGILSTMFCLQSELPPGVFWAMDFSWWLQLQCWWVLQVIWTHCRSLSPLSPFTACIITDPLFESFYIGISQLAEFILTFIYHLFIYIYYIPLHLCPCWAESVSSVLHIVGSILWSSVRSNIRDWLRTWARGLYPASSIV